MYALSACTSGNYLVTIDAGNGNAVHVSELGGTSTAGDVYFDGDGVLYVGLSGRVLISSDGGQTFEEHPFGISTVSVIESKHGQTWAGLMGSGAAYFDAATSTWRTIGMLLRDGGLAYYVSAFDISPSQTILASNSYNVAITYDGGETYQYFPFVSEVGPVGFGAQNFTRDAQNALFMLQGRCDEVSGNWSLQVYRSSDEGITWSLVSDFCQMTNGGGCSGTLVIDAHHSCSWAAVNGYAFQNAGLYRGDQECRNWALVNELNLQSFAGACLGPEGNIHVFASGDLGGGIYSIGSDGDWSFTAQPQGLVTFPSDFLVDADGGFWIASEVGLFYSPDSSDPWVQFTKQDGLASDLVNCVCVEGSGAGKVVWVGTALGASRGVFTE